MKMTSTEIKTLNPQSSDWSVTQPASSHHRNCLTIIPQYKDKFPNNTQNNNINQDQSKPQQEKNSRLASPLSDRCLSCAPILYGILLGAVSAGLILAIIIASWLTSDNTRTSTKATTTTSTNNTSTSTPTMCYTPYSPRRSGVWISVGSMSVARVYHTNTLISQDNSVFIAGGYNGAVQITTERFIPSTGCFQTMGNMPRSRYMHTADQLPALSGYVLLAGGSGVGGALSYADLFHPLTSYTLTIPLSQPRYQHTSTVLSSSQLVLIGGYNQTALLNSGDAFNVGSSTSFSNATGTYPTSCFGHTATQLGNTSNVALIAGGTNGGSGFYTSVALYHGTTNTFISLGSGVTLSPARAYHTATYLPPPINKVLIVGGAAYYVTYGIMSLFDVATLTFTTLTSTLSTARYYHTATLLPNGKVLIVGGLGGTSLGSCELIDPFNNYTSSVVNSLNVNRHSHTATYIPDSNNGTILVCGGYNGATILNNCELYFV